VTRLRQVLEAEAADVVVAPGHGFDIDEDAVARAHEHWQRDGAYNTIESVSL
jgi:hypothetical protein